MQIVPSSSNNHQLHFPLEVAPVQGKPVLIDGPGGDLTSDAGVLLLRETEAQIGIIAILTQCLTAPTHPSYTTHAQATMIAQLVLQIACGYPDATDCNTLRRDPVMQLAVDQVPDRAAQSPRHHHRLMAGPGPGPL